jgi:hypothetical protein
MKVRARDFPSFVPAPVGECAWRKLAARCLDAAGAFPRALRAQSLRSNCILRKIADSLRVCSLMELG